MAEVENALNKEQGLQHNKLLLNTLDYKGIVGAIEGITKNPRLQTYYRLSFEEAENLPNIIATDLLDDAGSALAPTLQILLTKMWEAAKEDAEGDGPKFTLALYQKLRKKGYLLGDFLEQQIAEIKKRNKDVVSSGLLLDILHFHTTPMGTATEHRMADIEQTYSHAKDYLPELIQKAVDKYILIQIKKAKEETKIRLAHDTLAPLVRKRFEESDLPGQRARRVLESRRVDWVEKVDTGEKDADGKPIYKEVVKDSENVLDEPALILVQRGREGMREWDDVEKKLIEASEKEVKRKQLEEKQRRQELKEAEERRIKSQQRFNKAIIISGLVILIFGVVAGVFAVFALKQRDRAEREATTALMHQLITQSQLSIQNPNSVDNYTEIAILLSLQSMQLKKDYESASAVLQTLQNLPPHLYTTFSGHSDSVWSVAFSPDSSKVVSGSYDNTIRLWDTKTGKAIGDPWLGHSDSVWSVAFSPDGSKVVSGSSDNTVRLWDTNTGETIGDPWLGHSEEVRSVAFSPNGSKVVSGSYDNTIIIWDANTGMSIGDPWRDHNAPVLSVAFSPDGSKVVSGSWDNTVRLWDT